MQQGQIAGKSLSLPALRLAAIGLLLTGVTRPYDLPPPANTFPLETDLSCAQASDQPPNDFRVTLTPAQEARELDLYRRSIVITAHDHCWTPRDFIDQAKAGVTARVIKPLTDGYYRKGAERFPIEAEVAGWQERGVATMAILQNRAAASRGRIRIIRTVKDIRDVKLHHSAGMILSFEGGLPLAAKLENLRMYYGMGLRELQLHWAISSPLKAADGGLTPFAESVIHEMDRLGIVLDISHMPERTFARALEITRNPVVVSHCAAAFTEHSKAPGTDALDDQTIRKIAARGGVICLHFLEGYIHPRHGAAHATVEDLVDHMDRIRQVAGIDYIGMGPDYSPMKGWRWVEGAENFAGMPNVVREMVRRGYTDEEVRKVLGGNLMRLYAAVWRSKGPGASRSD
jgi:membrane dipeptidase